MSDSSKKRKRRFDIWKTRTLPEIIKHKKKSAYAQNTKVLIQEFSKLNQIIGSFGLGGPRARILISLAAMQYQEVKSHTLTSLSHETGLARTSVIRYLKKMEADGQIKIEKRGQQTLVTITEEYFHVLYTLMRSVAEKVVSLEDQNTDKSIKSLLTVHNGHDIYDTKDGSSY